MCGMTLFFFFFGSVTVHRKQELIFVSVYLSMLGWHATASFMIIRNKDTGHFFVQKSCQNYIWILVFIATPQNKINNNLKIIYYNNIISKMHLQAPFSALTFKQSFDSSKSDSFSNVMLFHPKTSCFIHQLI